MIDALDLMQVTPRLWDTASVGTTGRWLASVNREWLQYHEVPDNMRRLDQLVTEVTKLWLRQLRRRSQRGRAAWPLSRMNCLVAPYLPQPKILHPCGLPIAGEATIRQGGR